MKNKKAVVFVSITAVILVLNHIFGWSSYLSNADNFLFLKEMVKNNIWLAIGLYMIVTIVGCVVLALPGVTFAILAGLLFGPWIGTLCCSLATTIGAVFAFLAGRFFLKESIKPMAMKNKYLKKLLFDGSGQNEIFILMITRLVPLFPFNLQNYAYGVTDIRFSTYALCSFFFMLPGTAIYTLGTAGVVDKENRLLYIGIATGMAFIVIGTGRYFQKRYVRADEGKKQNER